MKGIKKLKYRWYKESHTLDGETKAKELVRLRREISKVKKEAYRIIYLDETMFTRKTIRQEEWCLPKDNF